MLVTVAAVLRSGGDYTPEYVHRLRDGVAKFCTVPHRFVCLTDIPDQIDCETITLQHDWPGWWSKLELFALTGPVVYFDLDTVITGNINDFIDYPHQFTMLSNLDGRGGLASGVLAFNGDYRYLLDSFDPSHIKEYSTPRKWGDQGWISDKLQITPERAQEVWQDMFCSYKWGTIEERRAAQVVIYHGNPRPHQTGWKA